MTKEGKARCKRCKMRTMHEIRDVVRLDGSLEIVYVCTICGEES